VSPSVKPSSSTTVPHTTTGSPSPSLKSLSISVRVAHDPISRGSTQTVFVKVSDNGNSSQFLGRMWMEKLSMHQVQTPIHFNVLLIIRER
jgi:hypothetical protein